MKMIRRVMLACLLAWATFVAFGANLSAAQIAILRPIVLAEPTLATARLTGDDGAIAAWLNAAASPAFTVWKTNVTITDTGKTFVGTEWAGMTNANHTRMQTVAQWLSTGYNPSLPDIRAMFDDIWSGAGGVATRAKYLAFWKRLASRAEKALATGTGSDAVPATLTFEGLVTGDDCSAMR